MKLHLPSGLRKALLACLAAVALPAATIPSTIASASGIAAVFLIASQRAAADTFGPEDVTYDTKVDYSQDVNISGDTELTIKSGAAVSENKLRITGGNDADLKITAEDTSSSYILDKDCFKTLDSIWLSQGNYEIFSNDDQYALDTKLKSLYVAGDDAHLTFERYSADAEGYFEDHKLAADFYIGRSNDTIGESDIGTAFNLKLVSGITVETSGSLTIQGDFGYICLAEGDGSKKAARLAFDGSVSGSTLRLDLGEKNEGGTHIAGTLYLGKGGELTGTLRLFDQATVILGDDSTLKVGNFDNEYTSGTITTENSDTATLEITKGGATGRLHTGRGVTLKMNADSADAEQTFTGDTILEGNVVASKGKMSFQDGAQIKGSLTLGSDGFVRFNQGVTLEGGLTLSDGTTFQIGNGDGTTKQSTIKGKVTDGDGYGTLKVYNTGATFEDDVVLKGALQFGWGNAITIKTKVEVGSLLLDNGNHQTTFAKAVDAAGDVYVILKLSEEAGHLSQMGSTYGDEVKTISNGTLEYSDSQFLGLFGSGVVFGVEGAGKKLILEGGGTTGGGLSVGEGATLQLDGADYTVGGKISGKGTLTIATADDQRYLTLTQGGSIGAIEVSDWGAQLKLGADLTAGGMGEIGAVKGNRNRAVDSSGDGSAHQFILDVAKGGDYSVQKVNFGQHINIVKKGAGKQTFTEADVKGNVTVEAGELAFSSTTGMTIGGAVSITGGTMSWSGGTLTITGQLTTTGEGTLSVAYGADTKLALASVGTALSLTLTGLTYENVSDYGWDLFSSWQDGFKSAITVNGYVVNENQRYGLKIDENTHHIVVGDAQAVQELTWTSEGAEDTLDWSGNKEWDSSKTFIDYDKVTLAGGENGGTVNLSKDVIAGSLSVTGSKEMKLQGSGALKVNGDLTVEANATLSVGDGVTLQFGAVTGITGTLKGAGGVIDLSALGSALTVGTLAFDSGTSTTVKLGASGVLSTSKSVSGTGADLVIDAAVGRSTMDSAQAGIKATEGGTLNSFNAGVSVSANLNGSWNFAEESSLGALSTDTSTDLTLTLGGKFTLNGFSNVGWNHGGTKLEILADKEGVDFFYDCQYSNREVWLNTASGQFLIGNSTHGVNFIVNHLHAENFTAFGVPTFTLKGNLEIRNGVLRFYTTSSGTIDGQLSGAGTLSLTNSTFTIGKADGAGSIGTFDFRGAQSTVKLVGDLIVGKIDSTRADGADGTGAIEKADSATAENVYLLIDTGEGATETLDDFTARYKKEGRDVVTFGSNTGMGKAGSGELRLSAGAAELTTPFKLAAGTLTWTEGEQKMSDFTAVSGATLNVTGGNLQLGQFSGELTSLKLGGSGILTVSKGVLTAGSLEVSGNGATLVIDAGGNAQIKLTEAGISGGKLTIDVQNHEDTHYQLFDSTSVEADWWNAWYAGYEQYLEITAGGVTGLQLNEDGSIDIVPLEGVTWVGVAGNNTWSDKSDTPWDPNLRPNKQYVHFVKDTGGETHEGTVQIDGTVTPQKVFIDGGTYTFTQAGTGDGLDIAEGGCLVVARGATLHLNLKNKSIPTVDLKGTLGLGNEEALPTSGTSLQFNGGTLLYDTAGVKPDVSALVDAAHSSGAVKVQVSDSVSGGVTWGGNEVIGDNGGLTHALNELGIEKSGNGEFILEWKDAGEEHGGNITVTEGRLHYVVHTESGKPAILSGNANVTITGESAELELTVEGDGTLEYGGDLTGDGSVSLGGGKIKMSGDNSAFTGLIGIQGDVEVDNDNALGGAKTKILFNGGNLSGSDVTVNAGEVTVGADATLSGVTLAGKIQKDGQSLTAGDGTTAGLSGDISGYTGELKTGTSGTWKLSDKALDQTVTNAVSGSGTVQFDGDATYSGEISGGVTLEGSSGTLTVTSTETSEGAKLKGTVTLGDRETQAQWKGTELVSGDITLANVELAVGGIVTKNGAKLYVNTATGPKPAAAAYSLRSGEQGGIVNVNGMEGSQLDGITINESGKLEGVKGTITVGGEDGIEVDVYLAGMNVGEDGKAAIVGDESEELTFNVQDPASMKLHIGASAAGAIAESFQDNGGEAILHVVENGSIGDAEDDAGKYLVLNDEAQAVLAVTGAEIERDEQGNIIITGSAADVYIVRDEKTLTGEDELKALETSKATLLSRETSHLTLSQTGTADNEDDITVNNLVGVRESKLTVENTADSPETDRFTVHFNNTKQDITQKDVEGDGEKEDVEGQDTSFYGSITAGAGVDVEKEGLGTFTVGGNYTLEDGDTTITAGRLVLQGDENSMEDLVFNYTGEPGKGKQGDTPKEEERGLVLADGGTTTVNGSITESTDKTGGKSDAIEIQDDSKLVLKGESDLKHASITGDEETGGGTVVLDGEDASLGLQGDSAKMDDKGNITGAQLSGVDVQLRKGGSLTLGESAGMDVGSVDVGEGSSLDVGGGKANHVDTLTGSGTLKSSENGELHVGGGKFSGTLAGAGEDGKGKAGTLAVADGVNFTLDNANSTGSKENAWGVELGKGANLTVDVSEKSPTDPSDKLTLGDVNLGDGTMTVDFGENPVNKNALEANIAGVGKSGTLDFHSDGNVPDGNKVNTGITVAEKLRKTFPDHVKFTGAGNFLKDREVNVDQTTGELTVTTTEAEENKFERALPEGSKNALAGATMMWGSLKNKTQFESIVDVLNDPTEYAKLVLQLISMFDNGQNAGLESALGAVAGSSISTLGPALAEDLHRQLKAIRNRTTTMAGEVTYDAYDNLPIWHAWINGEGGYHKLDSDGGAPGYTLNNWGGTVGVDIDVTPQTTMGLAITAMYGDLKPSAADGATGNLDTAYLSAFLRATSGAWIHTFVVSGGLADVQLDRTVNYGAGSYHTKGSTDGYAVGAMYEVGYTRLVNKEGTVALQPVFNVEVRHASIKGYNETGSDAGLSVDDIGQDVVTFGMGARMQSIVGENAFNRTSIFEARLLVKADAGDRSGTAMNAMLHDATRAEVESAEVGAVGVEAGMGITIPLGSSSGSIFLDASVEWRKGWTSVDAAAGYRVNF